jgi:hypothetical protein
MRDEYLHTLREAPAPEPEPIKSLSSPPPIDPESLIAAVAAMTLEQRARMTNALGLSKRRNKLPEFYTGHIEIDHVFECCPYGVEGWSESNGRLLVKRIVCSDGQERIILSPNPDRKTEPYRIFALPLSESGRIEGDAVWNDAKRFRETCWPECN